MALNSYEKHSVGRFSLINLVVLFFVLINAFIGFTWIERNIPYIPLYGDTTEYLKLS